MDIKSAAIDVLTQIDGVLRQINADDYDRPIPTLDNATIGQHIRHTLEFFQCLQQGVLNGVVSYDLRERNIQIEKDPKTARQTLHQLREFIKVTDSEAPILFEVNYAGEHEEPQKVSSNFERELSYNIEHAVHHMAIFKIGLVEIVDHIDIPEGFGVAVSTLRYRKEQAFKS